jgi:phospholipid/cholesterol/gamma-HCH transport system ATP-binding protein
LIGPDAGDVLIRGRPLSRMSRAELLELRTEIGVMFQDGALFSAMTVYDNVAFPLRQHTDLYEHEIHDIVMEHLVSVGLAGASDRMPNELSGGMRKRAGLARGLALNPGILLCDEPDSGLDPVRTALLGELLVDQHARYGGTMVVVTHNVMLAQLIAEHMSVIWQGKVLESGLTEHLLASEKPFVQQFLAGDSQGPLGMDA